MAHKLMIGAGRKRRPNWITLDADPESGADIIATIPPLPTELRTQCWDEIEMIHVLEHFYIWDARQILGQLRLLLAPGGILTIEAPNILYAARVLCGLEETTEQATDGQHDMWAIYGSPLRCNPLYCHRWGYSPASLTAELIVAGFEADSIQVRPAKFHVPKRDFRIEARNARESA